ncbi:MAG: hypothetical protein KDA28_13375, partial [Phycisphaerales bacterium]|nr:hypothetical protein [Phycisphaerales bacterium]
IDILARLDATTFCLLLLHTGERGATTMIERIVGGIAQRFASDGGAPVSAAAGLVIYGGEGVEGPDELERHAREALRQSWRSGGGSPVIWRGSDADAHD